MLTRSRHRFNVTEYYRMAEVGVLKLDAKVELLNGQIIDVGRATPLHAAITRLVAEPLLNLTDESCIVSIHNPVRLDDYNEVHPDVMLLKYRSDYYSTRHPGTEAVLLLIEVGDSTLEYDREEKLPAYGRAGIAEVWIVNLQDATIEVYREPHFTGYGSKTVLRAGDQAKPQAFPDIALDVAELLKH